MTPYDTSRSLTRRVPIHDSPSVEEYHGPVNSTKLLISRSGVNNPKDSESENEDVNYRLEGTFWHTCE